MTGMEKDDEIVGSGNSYDFGARMYNPRLGRWLSTDPSAKEFPSMSPYVGIGNNPIMFKDPDGRLIVPSIKLTTQEKSQINATYVYLCATSGIFNSIFKELKSASQVYYVGNPLGAEATSLGANASFQPVYQDKKWVGGNVDLNKSQPIAWSDDKFRSSIAEEFFHAAQDRFERSADNTTYSTRLGKEVEAKVYKAYSGTYDSNEKDIDNFAKNKDVIAYFDALKSGDKKAISKTEAAFRTEVKGLGYDITKSGHGYEYLGAEITDFNSTGGATPLFDKVTKQDGNKN